ncbi:hypothetical protein AB0M50_19515, partial [Nonomuraea fuscirosea]
MSTGQPPYPQDDSGENSAPGTPYGQQNSGRHPGEPDPDVTVVGYRADDAYAGFVDIVDAVGGVEINVRAAVNDPKAGLKLK